MNPLIADITLSNGKIEKTLEKWSVVVPTHLTKYEVIERINSDKMQLARYKKALGVSDTQKATWRVINYKILE